MPDSISITGDGNVIGNENNVSVNKTVSSSGATADDFMVLLAQLRAAIDDADLDPKTVRILSSDLEIVAEEAVEENPDKSIVEAKLSSLAAIASNAATVATAGGTFMPLIHNAIQMARGLFQ